MPSQAGNMPAVDIQVVGMEVEEILPEVEEMLPEVEEMLPGAEDILAFPETGKAFTTMLENTGKSGAYRLQIWECHRYHCSWILHGVSHSKLGSSLPTRHCRSCPWIQCSKYVLQKVWWSVSNMVMQMTLTQFPIIFFI
jgi:hypothetical protein